jgi:hypothetical protein
MQIANYFVSQGERPEEFAIGLHENLNQVEGHDVGQFPGLDSQKPQIAQTKPLVAQAQLMPSI